MFLSPDEVLDIARAGRRARLHARRCSPSATGPRTAGPRPREWLDAHGYDSTLAYVRAMAIRVLEETGLLPHLNPGVMSWDELHRLKPVAPSMGMMLETTSHPAVRPSRARPHFGSPGQGPRRTAARARGRRPAGGPVHHRHPGRDRRDLSRAGRLDLRDPPRGPRSTATSRRSSSRTSGPSPTPRCAAAPDADLDDYRRHDRRRPARARTQGAHPGAAEPGRHRECARVAARRRGRRLGRRLARSPPTTSTPSAPGRSSTSSRASTAEAGFALTRAAHRAPGVRPHGRALDRPAGLPHVAALADRRRPGRATGAAGGPALAGARRRLRGRSRRPAAPTCTPPIDTEGRTSDRRADFDEVYGDWGAVADDAAQVAERLRAPERLDTDLQAALRARRRATRRR